MVVLRKVKASTLMETLVATVLIVVVFITASMILNNLFSNTIKNNTRDIDAQLNELQYLYINEKLLLPYQSNFDLWEIKVDSYKQNNQNIVEFEAVQTETKKTILKQYVETN